MSQAKNVEEPSLFLIVCGAVCSNLWGYAGVPHPQSANCNRRHQITNAHCGDNGYLFARLVYLQRFARVEAMLEADSRYLVDGNVYYSNSPDFAGSDYAIFHRVNE